MSKLDLRLADDEEDERQRRRRRRLVNDEEDERSGVGDERAVRARGGGAWRLATTTADLAPERRVADPVPSRLQQAHGSDSGESAGGGRWRRSAPGGALQRTRKAPAMPQRPQLADIIVSAATSLASLAPSDSSSPHGGPLRRPPPTAASSARRRLTKRGR